MFDCHVHAAPDVLPRRGDDLDTLDAYQAAGADGFVLKGHHEFAAPVQIAPCPGTALLGAGRSPAGRKGRHALIEDLPEDPQPDWGQSVDRGSEGTPRTPQIRSTSTSCASTLAPLRQATATTRQSKRPRGVTPTRRQRR